MSHGATAKCIFLNILNVGGSFATVKWHFFTHIIYFFFDLDFSHSSCIILHGASAKWRFLVFFVFSLQRGAPFLMYGMVDSSFINNELCVCVFECVFSWIRHLRAFEESTAQRSWQGRFFLSWRVNSFEQPRAVFVFVQDQEVFGFMSQGKFHFVPDVTSGACRGLQEKIYRAYSIKSVSMIAREYL